MAQAAEHATHQCGFACPQIAVQVNNGRLTQAGTNCLAQLSTEGNCGSLVCQHLIHHVFGFAH
jgi:hypothetical protein